MKFILTPNLKPPFNLRRISLPYDSLTHTFDTEDQMVTYVITRNKEVGGIPCETEAERAQCLLDYTMRHDAFAERHPDDPPAPELQLPPVGLHWVVDELSLPGGAVTEENDHDYFFDAWEWVNNAQVNMPKARLIQMDRIRIVRDAELIKLDTDFVRALEDGDVAEQQRIAAQKRALRDIPQTFTLASYDTPEALTAAWPAELSPRG